MSNYDIVKLFSKYGVRDENVLAKTLLYNKQLITSDTFDMSIYKSIPEATRHLYGDTPEEVVKNYLEAHQGEN